MVGPVPRHGAGRVSSTSTSSASSKAGSISSGARTCTTAGARPRCSRYSRPVRPGSQGEEVGDHDGEPGPARRRAVAQSARDRCRTSARGALASTAWPSARKQLRPARRPAAAWPRTSSSKVGHAGGVAALERDVARARRRCCCAHDSLSGVPRPIDALASTSTCSAQVPVGARDAHDQLPQPRLDGPVDRARIVARLVVAVLLELEAGAPHARAAKGR